MPEYLQCAVFIFIFDFGQGRLFLADKAANPAPYLQTTGTTAREKRKSVSVVGEASLVFQLTAVPPCYLLSCSQSAGLVPPIGGTAKLGISSPLLEKTPLIAH